MVQRIPAGKAGWVYAPEASIGVGIVEVALPGGGRFWVSIFAPQDVIAFQAMTVRSLRGLDAAFDPGWVRALEEHGPDIADDESWRPAPLNAAWSRVATVLGVQQWMPYDVDEMILGIDEGVAWFSAGQEEKAREVLEPLEDVVRNLRADRGASDGCPTDRPDLVTHASAGYSALFPDSRVAHDIAESGPPLAPSDLLGAPLLAEAIGHPKDGSTDTGWGQSIALALHRDVEGRPGAIGRGRGEDSCFALDVLGTPPRILRWYGPAARELCARRVGEDGAEVRVIAELSKSVESWDDVVAGMTAYAFDWHTGMVISRRPMAPGVEPGTIAASLPLPSPELDHVGVGVYHADLATELRTSEEARRSMLRDRHMIEDWARARLNRLSIAEDLVHRASGSSSIETHVHPDTDARWTAGTEHDSGWSPDAASRVRHGRLMQGGADDV